MANRKYSVIVFDLGNVLIPFDYNILIDKLDKHEKGLGKHFVESYFNDHYDIHRKFERGEISEEAFLNTMQEILQHKIDSNTFRRYFSSIFKENKKVSSLLPLLKQKYKLILLSNTNSIHENYGWENYGFLKYFDDLVLSHKVGAVKPEEKIYRVVEKVSAKPSAEHVFIDDIEDYVDAAKKIGWDGIHFTGYNSLTAQLKEKSIIN